MSVIEFNKYIFWQLNKDFLSDVLSVSYFFLSVQCCGTPGKEQCAWHNWVLCGYEKSMHTDKSWQCDQSTMCPDQITHLTQL